MPTLDDVVLNPLLSLQGGRVWGSDRESLECCMQTSILADAQMTSVPTEMGRGETALRELGRRFRG